MFLIKKTKTNYNCAYVLGKAVANIHKILMSTLQDITTLNSC